MRNWILMIVVGMIGIGCATEGEMDTTPYSSLEEMSDEVLQLRLEVDLLNGDVADLAIVDEELDIRIDSVESTLVTAAGAIHYTVHYTDLEGNADNFEISDGYVEYTYANTTIEIPDRVVILTDDTESYINWVVSYFEVSSGPNDIVNVGSLVVVDSELHVAIEVNGNPTWSEMDVAIIPLVDFT